MKYLALGPAGMGIFSILGSLLYLKDKLHDVEEISGASAGSCIGLFLALEFEIQQIIDVFFELDFLTHYKFNIKNFLNRYGFVDMSTIKGLFVEKIGFDPKFKDLKKKLHVAVYNLNYDRTEYFSVDTHPDMSVIDAIFMSMSIPIIFTSTKINDSVYVDGGIFEKIPLTPFLNKDPKEIFGIEIDFLDSKNKTISNAKDFLFFIYSKCIRSCSLTHNKSFYNILVIQQLEDVSLMNFKMSNDDKLKLFFQGYNTALCHSGLTI